MQIRETDSGLVGIDQERDSVTLRLDDQSDAPGGGHLFGEEWTEYGIDARRHVHASAVRTDPVSVTVVWPDSDRDRQHLTRGETFHAHGEFAVVLRTPVISILRPEGTAEIRSGDETVVDLDARSELTVGLSSRYQSVDDTIRVERSPDGLATAIASMGQAIDPTTPDRTWPSTRQTPPRIEWSNTTDVPGAPDTGVELLVPRHRAVDDLFTTSALAHYLGAGVEIRDELEETLLEAPEVDVSITLGSTPETVDRAASRWLRRLFYLDCHARAGGPHGVRLDGHDLLDDLGLDADRLYDASLPERLRQYVNSVDRRIHRRQTDARVPGWHLAVHVDPAIERGRCLHRHLGRLSDVVLPDGRVLDSLGDRSLWRDKQTRGAVSETATVVSPEERAATVGWDGPRRAVGAFNIVGEQSVAELVEDDLSVVVIRTSPDMDATALEKYRDRLDRLPAEVDWIGDPSADDVASTFEAGHDLVHVVGHQDDDGIRLPDDSHVAPSMIDRCRAQAFFLNSCGSIRFGRQLVERGAVAGAVTTRPVETNTAAAVGRDWSGLIALGWSIERALDVVRRRRDPDGYTVVGDGAHVVAQSDSGVPPLVRVDDEQEIVISYNAPRYVGRRQRDPISDCPYLRGQTRRYDLTDDHMARLKSALDSPILTESGLEWV